MLSSVRRRSRYAIHQVPHKNLVCYWPSTGPLPTDINRMPSDLHFPNAALVYDMFCNTTFFIGSMQVISHNARVIFTMAFPGEDFCNPYISLYSPSIVSSLGLPWSVGVSCVES